MNATDPNDLLLEGWAESSGCDLEVASRELEALKDWLDERGADLHVTYRVSLPEIARSNGRETSRKAAASIADLRGGQKGVYELIACNDFPQIAVDSPRKRRESLAGAGFVVDSGRTRKTRCGNDAVIWVASDALGVRSAA